MLTEALQTECNNSEPLPNEVVCTNSGVIENPKDCLSIFGGKAAFYLQPGICGEAAKP